MAMEESEARGILRDFNAIHTGHFAYRGGTIHTRERINGNVFPLQSPLMRRFCLALAARFGHEEVDTVIASTTDPRISRPVAYHLHTRTGRTIDSLHAKRGLNDSFLVSPRAARCIFHRRVLVVKPVLDSGDCLRNLLTLVQQLGGIVVGVGTFANNCGVTPREIQNVPIRAVVDIAAWEDTYCNLCHENRPVLMD